MFCYAPYFFLLLKAHESIEITTEKLMFILGAYIIVLWIFSVWHIRNIDIEYLNDQTKSSSFMIIGGLTSAIPYLFISISKILNSPDPDDRLIGYIGLFFFQSVFFFLYVLYRYLALCKNKH